MQKLNVRGKLLFGMLVTLAAAAPLACSDNDDDDGSGGAGGIAQGGKGGSAGTAQGGRGGGTAGSAHGGVGGGSVGGGGGGGVGGGEISFGGSIGMAGEAGMAGEGGALGGAGMAGDTGLAGEAGMAGAGATQTYAETVDIFCSTQSTLDCDSSLDQAGEKSQCVDGYAGLDSPDFGCTQEVHAYAACLEKAQATDFECKDMSSAAKSTTCPVELAALNHCFGAP